MITHEFSCYLPAAKPVFFTIDRAVGCRASTLLRVIPAELQIWGREEIRLPDLHFYKTSIPIKPRNTLPSRCLEWLQQNSDTAENLIFPDDSLDDIFPSGPPRDSVNVLVADPEVLELVEALDDPDPLHSYSKTMKKVADRHLQRLFIKSSPSEIIKTHDKLAQVFGGEHPLIHIGRTGGIPAVIFNPVLASLKKDLDNLDQIEVGPENIHRASRYLHNAVQFYKDEEARQQNLEELLNQAIGQDVNWKRTLDWADDITPSAIWKFGDFAAIVLELKNSLGISGDATHQAIIDYAKLVSSNKYKRLWGRCNFPVVLVGITANRIEISVAVCVGAIYVTKLFAVDVALDFHASDNIIALARLFRALSRCRLSLREYYRSVGQSDALVTRPILSALFPCPAPLDLSRPLPDLTFRYFVQDGQLVPDIPDFGHALTAMFIATLNEQEVVVKFTPRYNKAAHDLLAQAQLAPRLHACERVVGDLFMVVMDRVDALPISQLMNSMKLLPEIVLKKVEEAINLLHQIDIVFGDLREPNILYAPSEDRVYFVDFDWAGKDGEARYPATLNDWDLTWSPGVEPYTIMHKAHDLWQMDRLKALCSM